MGFGDLVNSLVVCLTKNKALLFVRKQFEA